MSRWNACFILFLVYFANCAHGFVDFLSKNNGGNKNSFEIVRLAQTWSPTNCLNFRNRSHNAEKACTSCSSPKAVNKWTIHGLWPSNRNTRGPAACSRIKYQASLLNSLRSELNEKWPSVIYENNDSFWSHEWKTHGTCANLLSTNTIPKYFSTSLRLFDAHNIQQILDQAQVLPGNNYELDDLYGVIKKKLGVNVFVQCLRIVERKEQYLTQVQVCFDKSLRLVDCDEDHGYLSSCKRHYNVIYARSC